MTYVGVYCWRRRTWSYEHCPWVKWYLVFGITKEAQTLRERTPLLRCTYTAYLVFFCQTSRPAWSIYSLIFNDYRFLSLWVKVPRYEVDHSHPTINEIKDHWTYTFTPNMTWWCANGQLQLYLVNNELEWKWKVIVIYSEINILAFTWISDFNHERPRMKELWRGN